MIKRFALVIFLSLLLFGGLFGWKFLQVSEKAKNVAVPPSPVVAATTVKREQWTSVITAVGSLEPVAGVEVSSEIAGKIKVIHFDSGHSVKRGELLLELDDSTDVAELKGLQASQQLEQAKFARSQRLIARNFISKSDFDLNKATLDEAKAAVAAKKAAIDKKLIYAPFSGRLGIRQVNVGQYLAAGDSIVPLQQLQPIYVDFNVPEQQLANLYINQLIALGVEAYPGKIFTGSITAMNSGIDKATRTVKLRATLDNPKELLRPGMFADVQVMLDEDKSVLTVPDTAITYNPYGDAVFALVSGNQGYAVQLRHIITGGTREGRVEVVKGLSENEQVVSAGQVKLRNGMAVTLDKQPAPGERENVR